MAEAKNRPNALVIDGMIGKPTIIMRGIFQYLSAAEPNLIVPPCLNAAHLTQELTAKTVPSVFHNLPVTSFENSHYFQTLFLPEKTKAFLICFFLPASLGIGVGNL